MQKNNFTDEHSAESTALSLQPLKEYFDNDEADILFFTNIVVEDWTVIRADVQRAVAEHDQRLLSDATHKMLSVMRMLKATRLEHARSALKTTFPTGDKVAIARTAGLFFQAIDEVIELLETFGN